MAWDNVADSMARRDTAAPSWHRRENTSVTADSSLDEWAKASKTDFTVSKCPLFIQRGNNMIQLHNSVAIVRDDNNARLGLFTDDYIPVQPAQIREFFHNFILSDPRFVMETMGAIKGGRVIWALAAFNGGEESDIAGSKHKLYALLATSFDGTLATRGGAVGTRVECRNTLQGAAFEQGVVSIKHNAAFDLVAQDKALAAMAKIAADFDGYREFAESLRNIKMTRDETINFLKKVVDIGQEGKEVTGRGKAVVDRITGSLDTTLTERGTETYNAWTALNAVTRYVDHDRTARRTADGETADDARLASAQFGSGAVMKAKAVKLLQAA